MTKLLLFSVLLSLPVLAAAGAQEDLQSACGNEISMFCDGVKAAGLEQCLRAQPKGLMKACRNLLKSLSAQRAAPAAAAAAPSAGGAQAEPGLGQAELKENLNAGIGAYMGGDYGTAADRFGCVLDSEKKQRTLPDKMLIPVIDNLGISYGQTGNFKKSQETLDYGLSLFPTHTPFNYNKACGYGETGDLASALAELEKAYANNPRLKPYLPDPAQDPSFAKFRKEPRFKEFLKRIRTN